MNCTVHALCIFHSPFPLFLSGFISMSAPESAVVSSPLRPKRPDAIAKTIVIILAVIGFGGYFLWFWASQPADAFDVMERRIAAMDEPTRAEARKLCEEHRDTIFNWSLFRVDCDRCALVIDEEGRRRLYGEATDPNNHRRIYWIIFTRADEQSEWKLGAVGVEE